MENIKVTAANDEVAAAPAEEPTITPPEAAAITTAALLKQARDTSPMGHAFEGSIRQGCL
jgi:hypothetical protein